ncbi:MAG TPA: thioesterase family protein [Chitinophagaceae bacterium]|nr:thioesterase family protein [Chitinophagaceae bacterium]
MARIKIDLPRKFPFTANIPVRITDINFGGHVGNDTILSIVHESRAQFFTHCGYTELDFAGAGTIMSDVAIEYKNQTYYGDTILASVAVGEITKVAFDLFYKLEKRSAEGKLIPVAFAKTWMVCYDYDQKKVTAIPEKAIEKIKGL